MVTLAAACMDTSMCWPEPPPDAVDDGDEGGRHGVQPGGVQGLVARAPHRRQGVVVVAAAPDRTAAGQDGEVGGRFARARIVSTERGNRHPDQLGPLAPQARVVETEGRQPPGVVALEHDVGPTDQPPQPVAHRPHREVERHSALRGLVVPPPQAALGPRLVAGERPVASGRRALGRLDQDDVGAQLGQQLAGEGGPLAGQLHDPDAFEGQVLGVNARSSARSQHTFLGQGRRSRRRRAPAARRTRSRCARRGTGRPG